MNTKRPVLLPADLHAQVRHAAIDANETIQACTVRLLRQALSPAAKPPTEAPEKSEEQKAAERRERMLARACGDLGLDQ